MKKYELNLVFDNHEMAQKWIDENVPDRTYNGEIVLMISHESEIGSDKEVITDIVTFG